MKAVQLLVVASVCCVLLGVFIGCVYVFLLIANIYSDGLMVTTICLFATGFLVSIVTILAIVISRTCWLGLIPVITAVVVSGGVMYGVATFEMGVRRRARMLEEVSPAPRMKRLGDALIQYAKATGERLPDAKTWCDQLLANHVELKRTDFQHPKPEMVYLKGECHFAFNSNLSGMRLSDVSNDTVLLFEADGAWNLAGTEELLKTRYRERGYVRMLFVGGHIRDYWFYKNAVRTFTKDAKHMYYVKPRWKP